jgi:transposase
MVHAACWAHARRQFFEVVQLNPRDPVATPIVAQMDELFAVDAEARRKTLTTAALHIRRQETARPLLDDIRSKIEAAQSVALPSSALTKACQYALTLWKKLTRFLEYPELELSTILAENSMRPVALGRKNWMHIGSPLAGPKVAAIVFSRGKLPQAASPGARLLFHDSPGACRSPDPVPPRPYSRCVGRPASMNQATGVQCEG